MKPESAAVYHPHDLSIPWIGVIDLQAGQAVHGIAGNRSQYRAVEQFSGTILQDHAINGQATALLDCYWREGLRQFYVADLDALQGASIQRLCIEAILQRLLQLTQDDVPEKASESDAASATLWLDLGLQHDRLKVDANWLCQLLDLSRRSETRAQVRFILATEAARTPDCLNELVKLLGPANVALGLDYKHGQPLGNPDHENLWYQRAMQLGVQQIVALDVSAVGTRNLSITLDLLRRLQALCPDAEIVTGGGIRDDRDAQTLLKLGASGLLVASRFIS